MTIGHELHKSRVIILVEFDVASRVVHHFNLAQLMHMAVEGVGRVPSWVNPGFATWRSMDAAGESSSVFIYLNYL